MINLPTENYATEQLYLGTAEVNLTSNNQSVDVTMNLKQAKMNISLTEVPTNVSSVSVTISSCGRGEADALRQPFRCKGRHHPMQQDWRQMDLGGRLYPAVISKRHDLHIQHERR